MGLSVYLGSNAVPGPGSLDGYEQTIVRDFERRMVYVEAPGTLTFTAGAYRILRDAFMADFCASLPVRIYDDCGGINRLIVYGEIILADIKWDLSRCSAEAPVQMGSVGARILDNVDLVLSPTADRSKNGVAIAPGASFTLSVFDPQSSATTTRAAYDWKEAMRHAIDFLTDGTVAVSNDWYDALPDAERIALVQGVLWRTGSQPLDPINWTLKDLWMEVAKRFNLWLVVRQDANGISSITVLEDEENFGTDVAGSITMVDGIKQSIDSSALFGSVRVGEERERNRVGPSYSALPFFPSLTHTEEGYGVRCLCNRGEVLDLVCRWAADHGILEHVMWRDTSDTGIDEVVCMLQYTASTGAVTAVEYASPGVELYNDAMLNYRIINRYRSLCDVITPQEPTAGVIAVNNYLLTLDTAYKTGLTVPWYAEGQNIIGPLDNAPLPPSPFATGIYNTWPIDTPPLGSDPDNAWTLASRYTASSTGMRTVSWSFRSSVQINGVPLDQRKYWRMRIYVRHYTSANTLINTLQAVSATAGNGAFNPYSSSLMLFMAVTDYLTIEFVPEIVLPNDFLTVIGLTFQLSADANRRITITTSELGIATGDGGARRISIIEFDRHVTSARWASMLDDPRAPMIVDGAGLGPTTVWIKKVSRDIVRGKTRFELIHTMP